MLHFLKKLLLFRVGQRASRGFAKSIGLHAISSAVGIVGGASLVSIGIGHL